MIQFRVLAAKVGHGVLEFEVQDRQGRRPLKLRLDDQWLAQEQLMRWADGIRVDSSEWLQVRLELECNASSYDLAVNGKTVTRKVPYAEKVETVERMIFRTGPWRGDVRAIFVDGEHPPYGNTQEDLAGADLRVPLSVYWIDDLQTTTDKQP